MPQHLGGGLGAEDDEKKRELLLAGEFAEIGIDHRSAGLGS